MAFIIRSAQSEDMEKIATLEAECFSFPHTADALAREADDGLHLFLAALDETDGTLLGYVSLMHVLNEGTIGHIAVAPSSRRNGIADALLDLLDRKAEELGLAFITLEVRLSNAPAVALYEKHGYIRTGTMKNYYRHPLEDALIMTKNRGAI